MLLVDTYLDKSTINGIGLFAKQTIPKGTVIWKFHHRFDIQVHKDNLPFISPDIVKFIDTYAYVQNRVCHICLDNARFMNHSSTPNTSDIDGNTVANKDISANEEITCNYYEIDDEHEELDKYLKK